MKHKKALAFVAKLIAASVLTAGSLQCVYEVESANRGMGWLSERGDYTSWRDDGKKTDIDFKIDFDTKEFNFRELSLEGQRGRDLLAGRSLTSEKKSTSSYGKTFEVKGVLTDESPYTVEVSIFSWEYKIPENKLDEYNAAVQRQKDCLEREEEFKVIAKYRGKFDFNNIPVCIPVLVSEYKKWVSEKVDTYTITFTTADTLTGVDKEIANLYFAVMNSYLNYWEMYFDYQYKIRLFGCLGVVLALVATCLYLALLWSTYVFLSKKVKVAIAVTKDKKELTKKYMEDSKLISDYKRDKALEEAKKHFNIK